MDFQKGTGVDSVSLFQATNHTVTLVTKKMEGKLVLAVSVYLELYKTETIVTETEKPISGGSSARH